MRRKTSGEWGARGPEIQRVPRAVTRAGEGADDMRIVVKPLETSEELEQVEDVQMSAWGMGPRGATPKEVMIAIKDNGGFILGAFDGKKVVGFALTLVGFRKGSVYLYSHMTGVSRNYQSRGIGYLLKRKQREVSLDRGFPFIAWTFDPIIARNAFFNFRKLGVIARNYLEDYYGKMNDSINEGWATDRFLCEWYVKPEMLRRVKTYSREPSHDAHNVIRKRIKGSFSFCTDWEVDLGAKKVLVEIPQDVVALKRRYPEEGRRWRQATREVFESYFSSGYSAVALLERGGGLSYLLVKEDLPPNIFAEHP